MHGRSFPVDCEPEPPEHYRQMRGLPGVEEVAKWMHDTVGGCEDPFPTCGSTSDNYRSWASDLLALFAAAAPRIKAEALREAAVLFEADFCGVTLTLRALADQIEGATA